MINLTIKRAKKATVGKTTSTTVKKLKAKKTYYVRVRAYKDIDGSRVYSKYSEALSAKTKK